MKSTRIVLPIIAVGVLVLVTAVVVRHSRTSSPERPPTERVTSGMAQQKFNDNQDGCYRWHTQVDPRKERITIEVSTLSDSEVEKAIGCLLGLEGQTAKARFYGDTRANYNKADRYRPRKNPATMEIAALYYVSYLFEDNWEHANAVVLVEDDGKLDGKLDRKE